MRAGVAGGIRAEAIGSTGLGASLAHTGACIGAVRYAADGAALDLAWNQGIVVGTGVEREGVSVLEGKDERDEVEGDD